MRFRQTEAALAQAQAEYDQARRALVQGMGALPPTEREALDSTLPPDFLRLLEQWPDAVAVFDRQLRHLYVNRAIVELSGLPAEALLGKSHAEMDVPEEGAAFFSEHLGRALATGERVEVDFPAFFSSRHYQMCVVPVRGADGAIDSVVTVTRDVSALKRVEAALRRSESRLAQAQRVADLGSWEWEVASGTVTWSRQLYAIFGVTPETFEPSYEGFLARVHPEDRQAMRSTIEEALARRGAFIIDQRIIRPDGEVRILEGRGQVVCGENGEPLRMIGTSQDVTDRRQAELELEQAQEQRRQLEKLEEIDGLKRDFLNAASHELRTPLTSIIGYCEFLEDELGGPLSGVQREFVDRIREGSQRLSQIVDDMLDFARLEAGAFRLVPQQVDIVGLVAREMALLRPQARRAGVNLEVVLPEAPLPMRVDRMRVGQVLLNLAGNAIKFTPEGGTVTVTLERAADGVRVRVADTGIGIPAEQIEQVFEKFYQVDRGTTRRHGGTGLGLAISKALVEAHGGEIGAASTPGVGSTFWFTLPAA